MDHYIDYTDLWPLYFFKHLHLYVFHVTNIVKVIISKLFYWTANQS